MIELFVTFFKLGLFTIGGGIAMIPVLQKIMVEDKKWFTDAEMVDIIAICQSMPGVIAVNMATYVGFKRRGFFGSLVSTIAVILPSFAVILLVAKGLAAIEDNPYIKGMLGGLRAAAVGLIILAVYQVGKNIIKDVFSAVGAVASFAMIAYFKISVVYVILLFMVIGVLRTFIYTDKMGDGKR